MPEYDPDACMRLLGKLLKSWWESALVNDAWFDHFAEFTEFDRDWLMRVRDETNRQSKEPDKRKARKVP